MNMEWIIPDDPSKIRDKASIMKTWRTGWRQIAPVADGTGIGKIQRLGSSVWRNQYFRIS